MKIYSIVLAVLVMVSCSQIEEKINQTIDDTANKVTETAKAKVKESIDQSIGETINSVTNSQDVPFNEVFPGANASLVENYKGRKVKLPNGTEAFILKYSGDKTLILKELENQSTTDEAKSDKVAKKIDGKMFMGQIDFFKNFLPEGTIDTQLLEDLKTNESIEFYQIKRFPKKSTIIVNPKNNTTYQFVMVS